MQDVGSGITLTSSLSSPHKVTARVIDTSKLGTGITLAAPLTKAHPYGSTVNGSATGLLSDSPQGQIIGVLNNDQDGLNYPAHKWGTGYYLNDLVNGGVGPWFNNINATPVSAAPNNVYGTVGIQRLQHNLPAVQAFRGSVADAVTQALEDLGQKYNYSIPLENPLLFKNTGSTPNSPGIQTVPAYLPGDQALYTPVLDDRTGRTDQVSFGVRGVPSLGDIGQYDSNTDPLVGGNENPYPPAYPSKPTLSGMYGQDSNSDYFSNLNFWASGTVHGPNGFDSPSEGLLRGVEFVATWFSYVIASQDEGGAVPKPNRPIAYFETTPKKPTAQTTVSFDAGFSRKADGKANGLTYYWDFGDGSPLTATTDPLIQHTFPTQAAWRDVKLLVGRRRRELGLVPAARADRLLPDVLPGARSADRAGRAFERAAGGPVRGAGAGRAGRDDRGGFDRRTGFDAGGEPDAVRHRELGSQAALMDQPAGERGAAEAPLSHRSIVTRA